jgi:hypothetical protein
MFPKSNLSRLSGFAALGIIVAVLGGCAETTSGIDASSPGLVTRQDPSRLPLDSSLSRGHQAAGPTTITAESRKVAFVRTSRFNDKH